MTLLNRKSWTRASLKDIAREYSKRVDNPSQSGLEKFVGSENIGRFDYHVNNWQSTTDVISPMKIFAEGDYLLVRRSLYASDFRERAPRANFEGVCSGDILTIQEIEGKVADGFLYCVLNSKQIWDYIVANASGSITRRIKWHELEKFEFPLPSFDEQQRFADLFQNIEQSIFHTVNQEANLKTLQKTLSNGLVGNKPIFGNLLSEKNCIPHSFGDICDCVEQHDKTPLKNGLTRFIGLENIESEEFTLQGFGNIEDGTTFTKQFAKGDVLFGKRRAYLKKVAVADFDGICSSDILVFRVKEKKMLPDLLPYYTSSDAFINRAVSTSAGSLSPRTKWRDLEGLELSIPDIKTQEKIVDVLNQLNKSFKFVGQQKNTLIKLKQKLLNEIFG